MIFQWTKQHTLAGVLSLLLIGAALFFIHRLYIIPVKEEKASIENELAMEQQLLEETNSRINVSGDTVLKSVVELQKAVPVKPFTEHFLLEMEKAEVVSNSTIMGITFSEDQPINGIEETAPASAENGAAAPQESGTAEQGNTAPSPGTEQSNNADSQAAESSAAVQSQTGTGEASHPAQAVKMPVGLKILRAEIQVESKEYEDFLLFIQTIENATRITQISSLSFSGPNETQKFSEKEPNSLQYSLTVSAFYYPPLEKFHEQLPLIETPPPANKANPIYN